MATNPIFDVAGVYVGALALVTDITDRRGSSELIWHQANFDELTGLPNRHMFMDRLRQEFKKADRGAAFLALVFIDLDHFKEVNDQLGHAMGDALLVEAARRIGACVRASDTLARLGGDEFTVILSGLDHVSSVERIAQSLVTALARPFELSGERVFVSASMGIALYPPDAGQHQRPAGARRPGHVRVEAGGPQPLQLLHARTAGGGAGAPDHRGRLARGDRGAAVRDRLPADRVPATGTVRKAEALLRWRHPTRGLLGPAEFIPFAESNGLIVEIGDWVFREAARQAQPWQQTHPPGVPGQRQQVAGAVPPRRRLYQVWLDYLAELGAGAGQHRHRDHRKRAAGRRRQGDRAAAPIPRDGAAGRAGDFGTGYSSLSHLKRFDIDFVKIDQTFVATLDADDGDLALCEAIIVMAHKLGLKVVAEGVETDLQLARLDDAGCDYAQGFGCAADAGVGAGGIGAGRGEAPRADDDVMGAGTKTSFPPVVGSRSRHGGKSC